jgi:hypothetical protein
VLNEKTCKEHQLALLSKELIFVPIFEVKGGENKNEQGSEAVHQITLKRAREGRFRNMTKVKKATRRTDNSG